jgi:hypothetical protein
LSDETVDALTKCPRLKWLAIDDSKLTADQRRRLRDTMPNGLINGR